MKKKILSEIYKRRDLDSHKYDFGHLLVIGGSKLYSGSPAFNSLAAYRGGVDLVTTVSPKRAADIIASLSPSLITHPLRGNFFSSKHLKELGELEEKATAVVIGGGMGRKNKTLKAINEFLKELGLPAVIDADGIHAVARDKSVLKQNFILTPHAHEFKVLTGEMPSKEIERRKKQVKKKARELGSILLLKGNIDLISDGNEVLENKTGNPYMTVGGTGDTLAGLSGALLARGVKPLKAAFTAAWINGKAGEIASEEKGEGLMADDLIKKIPEAIKKLP